MDRQSKFRGLFSRYSSPPPTLRLVYQGTEVAELRAEATKYIFRYLEEFGRLGLPALPGLPLRPEPYVSGELFRFFQERIPDLRRPEIREAVAGQGLTGAELSPADKLRLLAQLGARTVTDPFEFRLVRAA